MLVKVIRIGNSKGIRIPANILKECQITDYVSLTVDSKKIVVEPTLSIRENWDEAFSEMHRNDDDTLLINDSLDSDKGDIKW